MAMAERQAAHRHELERMSVQGGLDAQRRGQHYALVVVVCGLASGTLLIALGRQVEGLAAIFGPIAAAAGIFVYGRRAQARERREKLRRLDREAQTD